MTNEKQILEVWKSNKNFFFRTEDNEILNEENLLLNLSLKDIKYFFYLGRNKLGGEIISGKLVKPKYNDIIETKDKNGIK